MGVTDAVEPSELLAAEPAEPSGIRIGYARVSTGGQKLERQLDALKAAGCRRIFAEKESDRDTDRPELAACLEFLHTGDTLVVPALDRLSRSLSDLITTVGDLRRRGVGFASLHENLDTTTPGGRLVFHVFAAQAEFIRELIVSGTREGLAAARARGRVGGRPSVMNTDLIRAARDILPTPEASVTAIAKLLAVSPGTLYNHIPDLRELRAAGRARAAHHSDRPVSWSTALLGFAAGALISTVTAPVGVSGAVFLLPVQPSVLAVPSPAVTPTNLLFHVVAGPGALARYRRHGTLTGPLTRLLLAGTLPGVVAGAVIRVFAVPGPRVFRLLIAALLLPLGGRLCTRAARPTAHARPARRAEPSPRAVTTLALIVGVVGGIYGIGGGSILGPILVGRGMPVARVAPAALASTFATSAGAATYGPLALTVPGDVAPDWTVGIACGLGGLIGGYAGARLQPRLPERGLRLLLGVLATSPAALYLLQATG